MKNEPLFYKENHEYYCVLKYNDNTFIGTALCHPDDYNMESEKVGYFIALSRAELKVLQHYKNNICKPSFDAIKQLYYSMNTSSHFNENSYEARRIKRHIKMYEAQIKIANDMIKENKENLKDFLKNKENFKQKIKKLREQN